MVAFFLVEYCKNLVLPKEQGKSGDFIFDEMRHARVWHHGGTLWRYRRHLTCPAAHCSECDALFSITRPAQILCSFVLSTLM